MVLPGAAYTEKSGTYVNTEGRSQLTRPAAVMPGVAREDWKIIRAISEVLGKTLPYDDLAGVRSRMEEVCPALTRWDILETPSLAGEGVKVGLVDGNKGAGVPAKAKGAKLGKVVDNFYFTDAVSRSSKTMARCSAAKMARHGEEEVLAQAAAGAA